MSKVYVYVLLWEQIILTCLAAVSGLRLLNHWLPKFVLDVYYLIFPEIKVNWSRGLT